MVKNMNPIRDQKPKYIFFGDSRTYRAYEREKAPPPPPKPLE